MPALELLSLHKRYGDLVAVDRLDLRVERGTCFGLLGPNGAGKTTTLEMLEGITPPTSGRVRILGLEWRHDATRLRRRIGITLQSAQFIERLTVLETLELFASFYPSGSPIEAVLARVGLQEKQGAWTMNLSGGQRQRLAMACALVGDPELLFLDEPTTGLDPQSRRAIWEIVDDFRTRGRSVILTTHNMEEAAFLCQRVAVMDHGRIIADASPTELIARHGGDRRIELVSHDTIPEDLLLGLPGLLSRTFEAPRLLLGVRALHETLPPLLERCAHAGIRVARLSTHEPTLEDVFVALTGRKLVDDA